MKNVIQVTLLILLAAVLPACSGVLTSEQPAKQYYTLMPLDGQAPAAVSDAAPSLAVTVSAVPGLDTDRILVLGHDARLHRIANARWPDYLPEVLSSVLKRSLAASGQFRNVSVGKHPAGDSWALDIETQEFYGIRDSAGDTDSVRITFAGSLNCGDGEIPVALSDTRPLSTDKPSAIVSAHQSALDRVTRQLLQQLQSDCA